MGIVVGKIWGKWKNFGVGRTNIFQMFAFPQETLRSHTELLNVFSAFNPSKCTWTLVQGRVLGHSKMLNVATGLQQ